MLLPVDTPPLALGFLAVLVVVTALECALVVSWVQAVRHRAPGVGAGAAFRACLARRGGMASEALTPAARVALERAHVLGRAMLGAVGVLAVLTAAALLS
jgi:hypothetical protein